MSTRLTTTRKVVGSLAIAGTAAAVAGLGTYGSFTSSTNPVATQVGTGSVTINLAQPNGSYTVPASTTGFVPGDSMTRAVTLTNTGTSPLSAITLSSSAGSTNALTTDRTNGLQLAVRSCTVPYTQGGTASAPSYTCSGTERTVLSGPAVSSATLGTPNALAVGGSDNLVFSISLPSTADNSFQNLTASLNLTFTGVQRAAQAK
jgi:Camelysin metallo-endopeptidase